MNLKPQDIIVSLKMLSISDRSWTYSKLADELNLSPSQTHASIKRATNSNLIAPASASVSESDYLPNVRNLREFLIHGIKYVMVPERGGITRGIPTSYAAPPLKDFFSPIDIDIPVWAHPTGTARGVSFTPLHKTAPEASLEDPLLYELLALVDAIRGGKRREQAIASELLTSKLEEYGPPT